MLSYQKKAHALGKALDKRISTLDHKTGGNARFTAYLDHRGSPVGYGPTRQAAILDLKVQLLKRGELK